MKTIITPLQAAQQIPNGAHLMIGGFMCCGQPLPLIEAILQLKTSRLTCICNDAGYPDQGIGKLIAAGQVEHLITSHIGLNPIAQQKFKANEMKVTLIPQGTLAEKIRCAGAGLGGFLTPTGVGTEVEQDKQKITLDGKEYLLETPLFADFSIIYSSYCDTFGNCQLQKASKNFNLLMAMAARTCFVRPDHPVSITALPPDEIHIPGLFIDQIVCEGACHG